MLSDVRKRLSDLEARVNRRKIVMLYGDEYGNFTAPPNTPNHALVIRLEPDLSGVPAGRRDEILRLYYPKWTGETDDWMSFKTPKMTAKPKL